MFATTLTVEGKFVPAIFIDGTYYIIDEGFENENEAHFKAFQGLNAVLQAIRETLDNENFRKYDVPAVGVRAR